MDLLNYGWKKGDEKALKKKPNILFVFADQHRRFDLGCYGNSQVETPNLDLLADQGIRFTNCVSNSPVCVPARGSLLTGLYPNKHKALMNDLPIDPRCESIADVLKKAGYHTGYIGKWHLNGIPRDQAIPKSNRLGFEEWKVHNCNHQYLNCYYYDEANQKYLAEGYEPEIFGELAKDFIVNNSQKEKPWALYLSFATPHDPHHLVKDQYLKECMGVEFEQRENVQDKIIFKFLPQLNLTEYFDTQEYWNNAKGYFAHIAAIDRQVGMLVETLEQQGELENTLIVYTSDHGDMLGSQGMMDKQVPYEESIGIPLIVYWKNHLRSKVTDEVIGLVDLPVTLAGQVGAQFSGATDGEDLHLLLTEEDAKGRDAAYLAEYFPAHNWGDKGGTEWRAIRTKRYTFARTAEKEEWLLFDNETDPFQKNNLVENPAYRTIKKQLSDRLETFIEENDEMLSGIQFVEKYVDHHTFNESQKYFNKKVLIEE